MEEEKDVIETDPSPVETDVTPESSEQEVVQEVPEVEAVDETGVPYKNRYMEAQRKLSEVPQTIERTIEEVLSRKQAAPQQQEYTIEQLETFAQQDPKWRPWVESQKAEIMKRDLKQSMQGEIKAIETAKQADVTRYQAEQWVVNHPKFKECFVNNPMTGQKMFNQAHPLTQLISGYLSQQDPATGKRVGDRPDGLAVAAKMAYGDYALSNDGKSLSTVKTQKKVIKQLEKKTLIEGGGSSNPQVAGDNYKRAMEELAKTGSPKSAREATREYLKRKGILKD